MNTSPSLHAALALLTPVVVIAFAVGCSSSTTSPSAGTAPVSATTTAFVSQSLQPTPRTTASALASTSTPRSSPAPAPNVPSGATELARGVVGLKVNPGVPRPTGERTLVDVWTSGDLVVVETDKETLYFALDSAPLAQSPPDVVAQFTGSGACATKKARPVGWTYPPSALGKLGQSGYSNDAGIAFVLFDPVDQCVIVPFFNISNAWTVNK
jgi:hypothetical protein